MRARRVTNRLAYVTTYLMVLLAILTFIFYPYAAILFQALVKGELIIYYLFGIMLPCWGTPCSLRVPQHCFPSLPR